MKFIKDFRYSHNPTRPTEYKAGEECTLTGHALRSAKLHGVLGEGKEMPELEKKVMPEVEKKEAKPKKRGRKKKAE